MNPENFANAIATIGENPNSVVGAISLCLIFAGLTVAVRTRKDSPLAPYILQIIGLTLILPIVLLLSILTDIGKEATTGLMGTIVGYVFGTSQPGVARTRTRNIADQDSEEEDGAPASSSKSNATSKPEGDRH